MSRYCSHLIIRKKRSNSFKKMQNHPGRRMDGPVERMPSFLSDDKGERGLQSA